MSWLTRLVLWLPYAASTWLTRGILFTFARWEVVGREHVPGDGPLVLVGNHVHNLDPPLVAASVGRRVHPMAKRELFEVPLFGWFFHAYGAFPVRRFESDTAALRVARNILRRGSIVLMFPEGTRSRGRGMRAALPGAAVVALMAKAPVVPVAITGSNVRLPHVFFQWAFRRRPRIVVRFGEPMSLEAYGSRDAAAATDAIMRAIAAMLPAEQRGVYGDGVVTEGPVVARVRERRTGSEAPGGDQPSDGEHS